MYKIPVSFIVFLLVFIIGAVLGYVPWWVVFLYFSLSIHYDYTYVTKKHKAEITAYIQQYNELVKDRLMNEERNNPRLVN
jgi:hypothetical protein